MSIVLLSDESHEDPVNGFDLRVWNLLAQGDAEHIVFRRKGIGSAGAPLAARLPWRRLVVVEEPTERQRIRRRDAVPGVFERRHGTALVQTMLLFREFAARRVRVVATRPGMGLLCAAVGPRRFVYDGCDSATLYHARRSRALALSQPLRAANSAAWARVFRLIEGRVLRGCAGAVVPAEADAAALRGLAPGVPVEVVGNGTAWVSVPALASPTGAPTLAFHGGMAFEATRESALFVARDVFPLVRKEVPEARCLILGGPVFQELAEAARRPGVSAPGHVDDLRASLTQSTVWCAPMFQGAGVKTKLLEAMSAGLAVVLNAHAAEALSPRARAAVVIAEGARPIASEVVRLMRDADANAALRREARAVAESEFSWSARAAEYRRFIEETLALP
ncbi:MAG: glycosyltransferase [Candidatus Sumerlaeia bacterium]|nr:glycosyltransferase [Candidatus Sumerlaeia bacterium]